MIDNMVQSFLHLTKKIGTKTYKTRLFQSLFHVSYYRRTFILQGGKL